MSFNNNITPGRPPLLWSDVNEAFTKINENFDILAASVGGGGGLIDFETLDTNVSPTTDDLRNLGSSSKQWKSVHIAPIGAPGTELNGVWLGTAHIKGVSGTVDLPAGATIDGNLIIDPTKTSWKTINVEGEGELIASSFVDTLNLINGIGVRLTVGSGADSITFDNTGVTKVSGTIGQIGVSYTGSTVGTGEITLTNLGVLSLTSTTSLPSGRTAGAGINIDNATGSGIKITNTGVLSVNTSTPSSLGVSTDPATGIVTINNTAPAQPAFRYIYVDGETPIDGAVVNAPLNVARGYGITLDTDNTTKTLTIGLDQKHLDINGSIFADNSTLLVDGVSGLIPAAVVQGTFTGEVVGNVTGNLTGNVVGNVTGDITGDLIGYHYGDMSGSVFADDSSVIIDGTSGMVLGDVENATVSTQILTVGQIDPDPISGEIYLNGTVYGDLQGVVYGTTVGQVEGDVLDVNGDLLLDGTARLLEGDVKGSVFGDDSSKIVDGVENRVYTNSLEVMEFIKFPTYADATARDAAITAPEQGMVVLLLDNGSAVPGLSAYTGVAWALL